MAEMQPVLWQEEVDREREEEERHLERVLRFRELVTTRDCCTGYTEPLFGPERWDGRVSPAYRCGRCGEVVESWGASLSHDAGYVGCGEADPILTGRDTLGNVVGLASYVPPALERCRWCGAVELPSGKPCALSRPCPKCEAPEGSGCTRAKRGEVVADSTHAERLGEEVHYPGHAYRGYHTPMDPPLMEMRHDSIHHPECAGCRHAWGLHLGMGVGDRLPEEGSCHLYCGCRGYVAPAGHRFPWD